MRLLRRKRQDTGAATAGADPAADFPESLDDLLAEIEGLTASNREDPSRETERQLLRKRHLAGIRFMQSAPDDPRFAEPNDAGLAKPEPLPQVGPDQLTPGVLRAGILRDGCLLVRGLVPGDAALAFAAEIDRAYSERERSEGPAGGSYYEEFDPHPPFEPPMREWIKMGGGLLAGDSPRLSFEMIELFEAAGLPRLVSDYLGEPALISLHKTTLRKAEPSVSGAWHQDGFFMGPVRALNLWLSLSHCGDDAPGLDILPRRLEDYLATGTEGADLAWTISDKEVDEAAGGTPVIRPVFEPGDALLFDERFLHKTGSDPSMPNPRFAIESWFFGGSAFPGEYAPIAV
jgi:Phytanoyl-CoA dioxygenase (PhyH)